MGPSFFDTPSVPALWGSLAPLLALDILAVFLRFQTRRRLRQPLLADDWLMIPSILGVIALSAIFFHGLRVKAFGYRWMLIPAEGPSRLLDPDFVPKFAEPTNDRIVLTRRLEYSTWIIHSAVNGMIKLSVLLLYRRIFVVVPHWRDVRNLFFTFMMVVIGLWASAYAFAFIFMCRTEVQLLFTDPTEMIKMCVNTVMLGYSYTISDFLTDAIIILIPIPFIWRLHLPWRRKIGVMLAFFLGILAAATSLVRLAWQTWGVKQGFGRKHDEELILTYQLYWMQLEITLGLFAACLPTLRSLLKSGSIDRAVTSMRNFLSIRSNSSNEVVQIEEHKAPHVGGNYGLAAGKNDENPIRMDCVNDRV